mgnify:CR=1 FL=1
MKLLSYVILCIAAMNSYVSTAQVNLEFNAINEYAFNTREALNLVAVNGHPKAFTVFANGRITDQSGVQVAEFKSSEIVLNTGSTIITPMTASLTDIRYFNQDIAEIENRTGTYPSGNYTICVWLQCVTQDCNGLGQDAAGMEQAKCTQVHIENPTPLLLATPGNDEQIDETRPMFTWIPPSPVASSASLNYTMILVEIMQGQNKSDALSMNRPLIQMEGISNPALMFPSDLPELERGKEYAWQVEAFVGRTSIAKSEQWKFKVKKDTLDLKKIPKDISFIEIAGQTGTSQFYAVGVFKLRHVTRLQSGFINLEVKDKSGKIIKLNENRFKIEPGDNRLVLDLEGSMNFSHGQHYTLSGSLLTGDPFIMRFIYINPKLLSND